MLHTYHFRMEQSLRTTLLQSCLGVICLFMSSAVYGQQDCFDAISVCSNTYVQNTSFSGFGASQEVQPGVSCLGNGESNSAWYLFTVTSPGTLEFQLDPINPNDDYDFALYNLTNDSCSGIAAGIAAL